MRKQYEYKIKIFDQFDGVYESIHKYEKWLKEMQKKYFKIVSVNSYADTLIVTYLVKKSN